MQAMLKRWFAWFESKQPAWFRENSWTNEAGGGFVGAPACMLLLVLLALPFGLHLGGIWLVHGGAATFNGLSAAYEWGGVDPSGGKPGHVPLDDFGQRAAGSLLFVWVVCMAWTLFQ